MNINRVIQMLEIGSNEDSEIAEAVFYLAEVQETLDALMNEPSDEDSYLDL